MCLYKTPGLGSIVSVNHFKELTTFLNHNGCIHSDNNYCIQSDIHNRVSFYKMTYQYSN